MRIQNPVMYTCARTMDPPELRHPQRRRAPGAVGQGGVDVRGEDRPEDLAQHHVHPPERGLPRGGVVGAVGVGAFFVDGGEVG